jgi:hypothetical protein
VSQNAVIGNTYNATEDEEMRSQRDTWTLPMLLGAFTLMVLIHLASGGLTLVIIVPRPGERYPEGHM